MSHDREVLRTVLPGAVMDEAPDHNLHLVLSRLVGSRRATRLLKQAGADGVARWPAPELAAAGTMPLHIAERVVAAREFKVACSNRPERCLSPADAVLLAPPWLASFEVEMMIALALDGHLNHRGTVLVAKGGTSGASLEPRDVFRPLVRLGASSFVLLHNHPSGDPTPSEIDVRTTNRLARIGKTIGIALVDHVIVAARGTVSFADTMLLPTTEELDDQAAPRAN